MKKKLLFMTVALMCAVGSWAEGYADYLTEAYGWTQVKSTSEIVTDGSAVYVIALKDVNTRVMSIASESSTGQVTTSVISGQPLTTQLWYIELDTYGDGGYAFRSLANSSKYATASTWAWDITTSASSKNVDGTCYNLLFDSSYNLTIKTNADIATDGDRFWGWWKPGNPSADSYNLAGNKTDNEKLTFVLYKNASGVAGQSYTYKITNPSFETGTTYGWTLGGTSSDTNVVTPDGDHATTGADGTYIFNTWWQGVPITQPISGLPNGHYELTVSLASSDSDKDAKLFILANGHDETADVTIAKGNKGTFYDKKREFDVIDGTAVIGVVGGQDDGTYTASGHWWYKADNFRLTLLYAYATTSDYSSLSSAISSAAAHTLGFDSGEYAPYNNDAAITALNAANLINSNENNERTGVIAATATLNEATWVENVGEVDAVYNGNMAIANGSNPKGWTRQDNDWGQQVTSSDTDFDYSNTSNNTAWYYNQSPKSSYYGNDGVYTMPLKASTTYLLKVKYCSQGTSGGGLITSMKATVKLGETAVLNAYELGENRTRKFEEKSVQFTTTDAGNYVLELKNDGNFYFTDVSILRAATDAEKNALDAAIATAESKLGFEIGDCAPYNNLEAIGFITAAKSVDRTYSKDVLAATAALEGATWTANVERMNAFYDGQFANVSKTNATLSDSPAEVIPGWTHSRVISDIRQVATFSSFTGGRAMYFWPGSVSYGQTTGYTMPLKANSVYEFSFQYAGWDNEGTNSPSVSILNESGEGKTLTALPKGAVKPADGTTSYSIYFATDATPGNYVFTYKSPDNTNSTIGNLSLIKVDALEFADGSVPNYVSGTYPSVKITRTLTANRWATAIYPFAVSGVDNIAVLDSYNAETGALGFTSAGASTANQPFLMRSTAGTNEITLSNVEVAAAAATSAVKSEASLIGAYTSTNISNAEKNYVLSNNVIYPVGDAGATINPYRAYIQIEQSTGVRALTFFVDDDQTSISEIDNDIPTDSAIYNLAGQRVNKAQKGIYIVNGKKVLVK